MDYNAKINELLDQRARAYESMKRELDRDDFDVETVKRHEAEIDELTERVEALRRQRDRELAEGTQLAPTREGAPAGDTPEARAAAYSEAFDTWMRSGRPSDEQRALLANGMVNDPEIRALGEAVGAAGGYTVPETFWNRVVKRMELFGGMLQVANVITTSTGADLPWLTQDDTGQEGVILSENTQVTEQDVEWGLNSLGAFTYSSKLVRVALQLLQDTVVDVEGRLSDVFGARLGRVQNRHFTVGTGSNQPKGIVPAATLTVPAASATAVAWDELIELEHAIDPAYRVPGRVRYMFNDRTLEYLRKIKKQDGTGATNEYLWTPSTREGQPDLINGKPYVINQHMPDIATGNRSILFGDFEAGYVIRRVRSMQVLRLSERYADFLQVGFLGFARADGGPDDTYAYAALVQA